MDGISHRHPALHWLHVNLFSSPTNTILTLLAALLLWQLVPPALNWAVFEATFSGTDSDACKYVDEHGEKVDAPGACWTFVKIRWPQFLFGLWYTRNFDQAWRPVLAFVLALGIIAALALPMFSHKQRYQIAAGALVVYPFVAYALLNGAWLGLPEAKTADWGGLTLTLVLASLGIIAAFPLGVCLALARRSRMPVVKGYAVLWIEMFRGMPLITLLFIASVMLPYFFPIGTEIDKVVRAIIAITIFQSAYTAEAIRGGLSAVPRGQYEAAEALGFGFWKSTILITLPQALKISIPAIMNSFIQLFKDTSLVLIIGLLELLNIIQVAARSSQWKGYEAEGYIFAAATFFFFCYSMSLYSRGLERRLDTSLAARRAQQD
ncbi:MAG: amino acid ABC transporter permease [Betaproteobacteria bacterium AqS2]|uniref:Amino acid ABC transporter permease n=1 Tax=Candidatus Amphirhobacter heronislandensis TaxID=1732024 RepID=A0A930UCR8_9GAMM|nr:amino acid ABC transporter permease [Betaproteobacteria bacterium AqS2]